MKPPATFICAAGAVLGLLLVATTVDCWPWGSDLSCPPGPEPVCPSNPADDTANYFPHPTDCHYYIQCDGSRKPICRQCGPAVYFSPNVLNCLWPLEAKCEHNATTRQDSLLPPICGPDRQAHFDCDREGSTFRDPLSCDHYFKCTGGKKVRNKCPSGQHFSGMLGVCSDPCKAGCKPSINCDVATSTVRTASTPFLSTSSKCTPGVNCPTRRTSMKCTPGVDCPTRSTPTPNCIPGINCPTRSTPAPSCIPGVNCPTRSTPAPSCIPGVNCPTRSTPAPSCIPGFNCPTRSTPGPSCIPGVNCPTRSTPGPSCIPGVNCPTRSTPGPSCIPGVNCPTRSTPGPPTESTHKPKCISGKNCSVITTPKCVNGFNCEDNEIPVCFPNRVCDNPLQQCPVCNEDGQTFAHPLNCDWYYKCQGKVAVPTKCACGFLYNTKHNVCDYPCNVDCKNRAKRATQTKTFCQQNSLYSAGTRAVGQGTHNSKCG